MWLTPPKKAPMGVWDRDLIPSRSRLNQTRVECRGLRFFCWRCLSPSLLADVRATASPHRFLFKNRAKSYTVQIQISCAIHQIFSLRD